MRCNNIEVTIKIPVKPNEPDENGTIYTENAIIEACEKANNLPIITYNEKGEQVPIGYANNVQYVDNYIVIEGYTYAGGTMDTVILDKNKVISMEVVGFGLCK